FELVPKRRRPQNSVELADIGGKRVRKNKIFSTAFDIDAVRFLVGAVSEERRPGFSRVAARNSAGVEFFYPVRERIRVILTRSEFSIGRGVPIDLLFRSADWENRTPIFR